MYIATVPDVILKNINITSIIYLLIFCITASFTILKLFTRKKPDPEYTPGKSLHCTQEIEKMQNLTNRLDDNTKKYEDLKNISIQLEKEVVGLRSDSNNMCKNIDEMKQNNKEVANRLDDLLKQLMDWMNAE